MRRVLRWMLAVLALLLITAGAVAAVYVGPDDTVMLDESVPAAEGSPIVTNPRLLAYDDLAVVVTARAEKEAVLLAAGNPVDVGAYVDTAGHYFLASLEASGAVAGELRGGGALAVPPGKAGFFTDATQGRGEQRLVLELDGSPTQLLVSAADGTGTVSLAFGARIDGLFWLLVGTAVAGLVLLGLAALSLRRARRRHTGASRGAADPAEPARASTSTADGAARRTALPVALAALGLVVSGCGMVPDPIALETPRLVPLQQDELAPMLADYDRRHNRAVERAMTRPFDLGAWNRVDHGALLAADRFRTKSRKITHKRKPTGRETRRAGVLYTTDFTAYPVWALASSTVDRAGEEQPAEEVGLFVRDSPTAPWLQQAHASLSADDLPEPLPAADAVPTKEQRAAAKRASRRLIRYWEQGRAPRTVKLTEQVREPRAEYQEIATDVDWIEQAGLRAELYSDGALRVVPTRGETLMLATYRLVLRADPGPGVTAWWTDEAARELWGDYRNYLQRRSAVTVLLGLSEDGRARVLGSSEHEVQ